jgi:hypothetical protein
VQAVRGAVDGVTLGHGVPLGRVGWAARAARVASDSRAHVGLGPGHVLAEGEGDLAQGLFPGTAVLDH